MKAYRRLFGKISGTANKLIDNLQATWMVKQLPNFYSFIRLKITIQNYHNVARNNQYQSQNFEAWEPTFSYCRLIHTINSSNRVVQIGASGVFNNDKESFSSDHTCSESNNWSTICRVELSISSRACIACKMKILDEFKALKHFLHILSEILKFQAFLR